MRTFLFESDAAKNKKPEALLLVFISRKGLINDSQLERNEVEEQLR